MVAAVAAADGHSPQVIRVQGVNTSQAGRQPAKIGPQAVRWKNLIKITPSGRWILSPRISARSSPPSLSLGRAGEGNE